MYFMGTANTADGVTGVTTWAINYIYFLKSKKRRIGIS
jgi:hypothetical protein